MKLARAGSCTLSWPPTGTLYVFCACASYKVLLIRQFEDRLPRPGALAPISRRRQQAVLWRRCCDVDAVEQEEVCSTGATALPSTCSGSSLTSFTRRRPPVQLAASAAVAPSIVM